MLAILTTHPIQYQVPVWKELAQRARVPFCVYFMSELGLKTRRDPGFGQAFAWDIDLLGGYEHHFVDVFERSTSSGFGWLTLKPGFGRLLRAQGTSVLWVLGWQVAAYFQAIWVARRLGIETWMRGETNLRSSSRHRRQLGAAARGWALRNTDQFLCIGEANRLFYLDQGIAPERLHLAPYCVDNGRFLDQAEAWRPRRAELRTRWNIPQDSFCVLFAGKFTAKKRPFDLVQAIASLAASEAGRQLHLLWVGSGELGDGLRAACDVRFDVGQLARGDATSARPAASFVGFLNQSAMAEAYVAADCLVLPSEGTETWGLVVNEAMATGLPCIVSDACGSADDLVLPFRPDLCFRLGDIAGLRGALQAVMARPPSPADLQATIAPYDCRCTVDEVERLFAEAGGRAAARRGEPGR